MREEIDIEFNHYILSHTAIILHSNVDEHSIDNYLQHACLQQTLSQKSDSKDHYILTNKMFTTFTSNKRLEKNK